MTDPQRWNDLWKRLGGQSDEVEAYHKLVSCYREPHRAYHNLEHIDDCLCQLDDAHEFAQRPDEVEAAVWFHDVVYDTRASDNEEQSAEWAVRTIVDGGVSDEVAGNVSNLILATQHQSVPPEVQYPLP